MNEPIITRELAERIEHYESEAHVTRALALQSLRGNPLGVEVKRFGGATAFTIHGAPYQEVTRVFDLGPGDTDQIQAIRLWSKGQTRLVQIDISPFYYDDACNEPMRTLAKNGFYQARFLTVLCGVPDSSPSPLPVGVSVREFTQGEIDAFAQVVCDVQNVAPADLPVWQAAHAAQFHDWCCYAAYVEGQPAAHGVMRIKDKVAMLMFAATKTQFRGYGAQTALLRQRIANAAQAGCELVICSSYPGTISQRNQQRAGLRIAYTKALWMPFPTG
ncbi:MAG TPA: GNAT family N-acetyltransferase [Anaerolineaceae bacterium]|nr:GNAT family N-acetyltransferase [Anaerolineaceae bacterium]